MGSQEHFERHADKAADSAQAVRRTLQAHGRWRGTIPLAIVAVAAVVLRLFAAQGDLVLDEIWSWRIAAYSESAWEIVVLPVDNNHILNTLVLYAVGPRAPVWAYRLPAVLAGSLALWFAFRLARRQGAAAAFCVLTLLSFSHVLIVFGTEARGYGYLACCTLAAWWVLEKYFDRLRWRYSGKFGLASSLAFLSHLTFLFAYLAFVIYSVMTLGLRRGHWQRIVVLHALPVLTCVILYIAYVQEMAIGGGDPTPMFETLLATLSLMAGGPERGEAAYIAAGIMAALVAASLVAEFRSDRARGILFLTAIIIAPGVVLAVTGHAFVYPRYFLVPMIFGYVAIGSLVARWFQGGRIGRTAAALLLACYVACNLAPVVKLIREGRGEYSTAMRWMAEHTATPAVTVASDHDWRNRLLVVFYANRDSLVNSEWGKEFVYVPQEQFPPQGTEWFLRHSFAGTGAPAASFTDSYGNKYELAKVFPAGSISGWTWWLYHRTRG